LVFVIWRSRRGGDKSLFNYQKLSRFLVILSIIGVTFAAYGTFRSDVWLASTQWLLVAVVLIGFSIYSKLEE